MKIISEKDVPSKFVNLEGSLGVDMAIPIGKEDGSPTVSMRILTVTPGGHTPYHEHPFEHVNYVVSGEGIINTESGEYWIQEGDCILLPAGMKHNYENLMSEENHNENLVFLCIVPKEYECGCPEDEE